MPEAETRHEGGGDAAAYRKGAWSKEEDEKLKRAVEELGDKNWVRIERFSGLARPAKNCRLRWLNYLRPNLKKYPFTKEEEDLIFHLHAQYGNAWSRIASKLPGRSDNEIKNFWHKRAKKRQREELRICPTPKHKKQNQNQNHTLSQLNIDSPQTTPTSLFSQASPQPPIPTTTTSFLSPHQLPPPLVAQLNSPYAPPLNLRLSMPIQDSILELNSSSPAFPITGQLPSIQFNPPERSGLNSSNLEMINELRKAQARVRFLKKKLRQRGISNNTQSSRKEHLFIEETHLLTTQVPLDEMNEITGKDSRSIEESGVDSEMPTHGENSDSKASLEKGFEREEEVSIDEIFKMKNSETFPEQRHHNWTLQELEGDLFGERSQIDEPFSPKRHGDVYSQTTLERPGDESGQLSYGAEYFKCSLGQEFSDIRFPVGAESLPVHQNTAVDLVEVEYSNFVSQPMASHSAPTQLCQSSFMQHQYHEAPQSSLGGTTERTLGEETWKQELMEGLVADNLWVEDEKFFLDRYDLTC